MRPDPHCCADVRARIEYAIHAVACLSSDDLSWLAESGLMEDMLKPEHPTFEGRAPGDEFPARGDLVVLSHDIVDCPELVVGSPYPGEELVNQGDGGFGGRWLTDADHRRCRPEAGRGTG